MLFELLIFAVVLVVLQTVMGLLMCKFFMTEKNLTKMMHTSMKVAEKVTEEIGLDE